MSIKVVIFPGSNCDHDVFHAFGSVLGQDVTPLWHASRDLGTPDLVILPGGFSYGDYLRTGALAKLSPAMEEVSSYAKRGGKVLGICNGFQILCESGLLPGVLLQNVKRRFLSQFVNLKVENPDSFLTSRLGQGAVFSCPIAHGDGNFFTTPEELKKLEGEGQVLLRYCSPAGEIDDENFEWNPNGSLRSIAGICNSGRNVIGLMPHPERASEKLVGFSGGDSAKVLLESCIA